MPTLDSPVKFCKCGKPLKIFQTACFDCRDLDEDETDIMTLLAQNIRHIPEEGVDFYEMQEYCVVLSATAHVTVFAEDASSAKEAALAVGNPDYQRDVEIVERARGRTRQMKPDGKTRFDKNAWLEEQKVEVFDRFMRGQTKLDKFGGVL